MTRFGWALLALIICLAPVAKADDVKIISGDELKKLIPGSTLTSVNFKGQKYNEIYDAKGGLKATSDKVGGGCCIADTGTWRIDENERFCRKYDNWNNGKEFCLVIMQTAGSSEYKTGNGQVFTLTPTPKASAEIEPTYAKMSPDPSRQANEPSRTCSSELSSCRTRCSAAYHFQGQELENCKRQSCPAAWNSCMKTGVWLISRTGEQIPLVRK